MDNIVLTEKGLALRDKLNAGQTTATFTRFCTSSAEYDQSELGALTELKDSKLESAVTNLEIREDHTMVISGAVDNKFLQEGYYITLIGLYAKETDGEEILFAVSKVSSPMYMPEKSGALSGMSIRFSVKIENSDSINVTVDPTTAATLGDLNALRSEVTTPTFEDYESEESPALPALEDAMKQIKSGNTMRVILQNTKAAFKGLLNLVNAKVNQKDYDAAVSKLNGDISTLSGKISSFDGTKSDIVSSGLGKAIGLTSSSTWANIVNVINGIANRGTNQYAGDVGQGTDYIALNKIPVGYYGPANGSWSPEIRTPKSNFGSATSAQVLSGATFTSTAGLKATGTMKNWSKSIQTATTSTADQSKSCYRISNGNIEVVPAIGYWGMWDWNQSCIRVPIQSAVKYAKTTLTTSNNEYTFKNATNNNPEPRYFTSWDLNFSHKILSAKITIGNEVNMMSGDGYCTADGPIALAKTHPSWNTDRYFYFPSRFGGYKATVEIWYI